jgi:hypothetical protein
MARQPRLQYAGALYHVMARGKTPEPTLVSGMKWLLSAYSQGWNRSPHRPFMDSANAFRPSLRKWPAEPKIPQNSPK